MVGAIYEFKAVAPLLFLSPLGLLFALFAFLACSFYFNKELDTEVQYYSKPM